MPKLLILEGGSGSGKTTIGKFAEQEMDVSRYGIDEYVRKLLPAPDYGLSPLLKVLDDENVKNKFWDERGIHQYSWSDAAKIIEKYRDQLKIGRAGFSDVEKFVIGYALLASYSTDLERSLSENRDTVIEGGPGVRRVFVDAPSEEKYMLKLNVRSEIAIERKMKQRNWDREKATKIVTKPLKFYTPDTPEMIRYWERDNNTREDLEAIKQDLRELF